MQEAEQQELVRQVSLFLGTVAATMTQNESVIDTAIEVVTGRMDLDPGNVAAPLMLDLLQASKLMIKAHKLAMSYGEHLSAGSFIADPPDTIQ